jgi:hypothetical protein
MAIVRKNLQHCQHIHAMRRDDVLKYLPQVEGNNSSNDAQDTRHSVAIRKRHVPQDDRELLVSKRQSPKTKIRCCVRDAIKTELDRMDGLKPV